MLIPLGIETFIEINLGKETGQWEKSEVVITQVISRKWEVE